MDKEKFTLYLYEGDYGLPSMDIECSQVILYSTIAQVPIQVKYLNTLKNCIFYSAPTLVHKNLTIRSFGDILPYLQTFKFNLDSSLTAKQKSECLALTALVQTKLKVVYEYVSWIEQRNSEELSKLWFMKALPLPCNYVYTRKMKENAVNLVESMYPPDYTLEMVRDSLTNIATEVLSSLSIRLGTSNYFFGNTPATLDVIIYSYIAPLVKIPFPTNDVSNLIALWPNLGNLVKRIDAKYLPELPRGESKYIKNAEKNKTPDEEVSYVAITLLTVSAVSLLFGFAVHVVLYKLGSSLIL